MVFEYVQRAWEAYKKNAMSFVVAQLVALIIVGIIAGIGIGIIFGSVGISSLMELTRPDVLLPRIVSVFSLLAGLGTAIVFFVIALLVCVFLTTGIYGMAAQSLRGKTRVETMFEVAKKRGITGVLNSIVVCIIALVLLIVLVAGLGMALPISGFIIGMILFFLIMIFFSLTFPGIIVDGLGAIESIEKSFNIVKKNYFKIFGLLLFYIIVGIVVSFIPILGALISLFVITPMLYISLVFFYKRNK